MQILHRGIFMPAFDRILQLARMEEMDCEFVEVTAHEGARPTHAVWQGRVYHRGGAVVQDGERYEDFEVATGYGTGPGLCGWCCRHNFYPFYPGVSVRNYTDERLAELDARSGACRTGRLRRGGPHGERHQEPKPGRVSRLVKRAGADTTLKNAVRDGAEWAWVPHGDTCPFCITLASNGWQKASSKVLKGGHAEHIHANCDCEFAIRFDHKTTVAGYDPEKYLKQYRDAGGDINKMRRVNYAANKERINAQKRAAYAARKGYTNQAASAILDTSNKIGVNQDVNFVCKIDRSLYRIVEQDLVTDEVIITEQQILHIEEGHPGDYNRLAAYIPDVLQQPDYILRGNRPHTALVLKQISTPEMTAEVVLRLKVSGDPEEYKNSIITMWNISQKRFRRLLRQSEILYKKE